MLRFAQHDSPFFHSFPTPFLPLFSSKWRSDFVMIVKAH